MGVDGAAVYFAAGSVVAFLVGMSLIAPWWRSPVGRTMAYLSVAIFVALLPSVLHYGFGFTPARSWFAWFYRAVMVSFGAIHWWRLWMFWRIQRDGRSRRSRPP